METERASQENSSLFMEQEGWGLAPTPAQMLWISGKDAPAFLQGMCTQQLKALEGGDGVWALFLNAKGGLLTTARIWKSPASTPKSLGVPGCFLVVTPPGRQTVLFKHLQKHLVSEDVELREELSSLCVLELAGPKAKEGVAALEAFTSEHGEYPIWLPGTLECPALLVSKHMGEALAPAAFPCLEEAVWEGLRMEYGRATWGKELEAGCLATEFRLGWAIHNAKGCYIGQEAVARTTFRTVPRKRLGAFICEDASLPPLARGHALFSQGEEVGRVLSSSTSPALHSTLSMAHVLRAYAEPGQVLDTAEGVRLHATVPPLWLV